MPRALSCQFAATGQDAAVKRTCQRTQLYEYRVWEHCVPFKRQSTTYAAGEPNVQLSPAVSFQTHLLTMGSWMLTLQRRAGGGPEHWF